MQHGAGGNEFQQLWHGQTTVHPLGLSLLLAMGVAMLVVRRRYAVWPMIVVACFIAPAQRIVVAGADFDFLRIMVVFGWLRLVLRGELRPMRWGAVDVATIAWVLVFFTMSLLRLGTDILANQLGFLFDVAGMYLLFRMLVREWADVKQVVFGFALISVPVAAAFTVEALTARNMFAVLGGVPEITVVRDGRLRCQGAFAHPILAGLFWASFLPLFFVQAWEGGRRRLVALAGIAAAGFIIVACASASPITGVMFALIGGLGFFVRSWMQLIRWGVLFALIGLHLVMKAPVWHLISRLDIVGGNSGYHRFLLIDGAINHVHEWWAIGTQVGTRHWGHHTFDVTNYYLVQCLHGGLLLLCLFVALISLAFRAVGRTWRRVAKDRVTVAWSWAMGVSLFVHATSFLVISYFGQITMVWYLLLAMIGSMTTAAVRSPARQRRARRVAPTHPRSIGQPISSPARGAGVGRPAMI